MPAEWEPHAATWLAWPHNKEDWPGKFGPIPWVFADIIRWLAQHERVRLLVKTDTEKKDARDILKRAGADLKKIDFYVTPTDRIWLRDSGAIFVRDSEKKLAMLDWRFNAWAKYKNHKLDDKVPEHMAAELGYPAIQPMHKNKRVVLEGGSIDVNGKGTLLTTEECLLSQIQERNPSFTRADYETVFEKYLGISQVIWLGDGIVGDDTHGHVDDLARFTDASTVVTVVEKDKRDDNYARLADNLKRLKRARDQNGKQLNVVELPMPKPLFFEGQRLPASYANFYIANKLVIVPTFNDPNDRLALNVLSELFPGREVVGIHCGDFIWGLGTLHCMSQQEPA
jgi:agmatine deiminase